MVIETLGQSMREGAKLRGKASSVFYHPLERTSCAWGAVVERRLGIAALMDDFVGMFPKITAEYPWVYGVTKCPLCSLETPIKNLIIHLNDEGMSIQDGVDKEIHIKNHNMSREWIADWLDSIDPTSNWVEFQKKIEDQQSVEAVVTEEVVEEVIEAREVGICGS